MTEIRIAESFEELTISTKINLCNLNVFFSPNYKLYIENNNLIYIYIYSLKYIIPIIINKKFVFKIAFFPVEPFLYNENNDESETIFLNKVILFAKNVLKIHWFTPSSASAIFYSFPEKSQRIKFGSHVINLLESEDLLFSKIHPKHRNVIKKAFKNNIIIKIGRENLIPDYVNLDEQTWQRSKQKNNNIEYYENIVKYLNDNAIIFVAYHDDIPQAGAIYFYNNNMSFYMFGSSRNKPYIGSANLLQWEAIKYMKNKGVKKFSFVGARINEDQDSKYHTIQRFKERFGGELMVGYMFKVVLNKFMYNIYLVLMKLKKNNEFNIDVIEQEIYKWKDIN